MSIATLPEVLIGSDFIDKVCPLIARASESIKIIVFDFRLYPSDKNHPITRLVSELQKARLRGVEVKILANSEVVISQLKRLGFQAKSLYSDKLVHAKMMLIDNQIAVVGSHNYTQNAMTMNLEVSVAVDFGTSDNGLKEYFDHLWPL